MKKTMLLVTAIAALTFTSCSKKETLYPETNNTTNGNSVTDRNFKYVSEIRIFDETEKFHVDVVVKSDNKGLFDRQCEATRNSKMKLVFSRPNQSSSIQNSSNSVDAPIIQPENPVTDENLVMVDFKAVSKGDAVGFTIANNLTSLSNKTNEYVYLYQSVWYHLPSYCNSYQVTRLIGGFFTGYDYYYSSGSWVLYSSQYIYNSWIFSGPGYTNRSCWLIGGPSMITVDISIYS